MMMMHIFPSSKAAVGHEWMLVRDGDDCSGPEYFL